MPRQTLEEKRLEMLRRQLSSRPHKDVEETKSDKKEVFKSSSHPTAASSSHLASDTTYLRGDLIKVFILSACAIAAELSLYFLSHSGLINLNSLHF